MGDSGRKSMFHEGLGAGKTDPGGGHIIVNEKNSYRKRKTCGRRKIVR